MTKTTLTDVSEAVADAAQTAEQSVVTVLGGRPVSGTVIADGQVLTTAHTLHSDEVRVLTADGQELQATVAGRDPSSDLALLKVDGLTAPALHPSRGPRLGELLLAVGRPPHGPQVSLGLMERGGAVARGPLRGWMPTGAAPFRGVSGGALVDARGELVGLLNAGVMRGTLVAVPAERAFRVAGLLASTGRVPRGYLGLATQPVHFPQAEQNGSTEDSATPDRAGEQRAGSNDHPRRGPGPAWGRGERGGPGRGPWGHGPWNQGDRSRGPWKQPAGRAGLTVVQVEDGSPAALGGLIVGDILLALDGEAVGHPRQLLERVRERGGETISVRLLRGGQEQTLSLTVGER